MWRFVRVLWILSLVISGTWGGGRVRLEMVDEKEGVMQVDMMSNGTHYFFFPVPADGTVLPLDADNLVESPDPLVGRVVLLSQEETPQDESVTRTNIDTVGVKSPSSRGNPFNQSYSQEMMGFNDAGEDGRLSEGISSGVDGQGGWRVKGEEATGIVGSAWTMRPTSPVTTSELDNEEDEDDGLLNDGDVSDDDYGGSSLAGRPESTLTLVMRTEGATEVTVGRGETESISTLTTAKRTDGLLDKIEASVRTESMSTSTEGPIETVVSHGRTESMSTSTEGPIETVVNHGRTDSMSTSNEGPDETTVSRGMTESLSTWTEGPVETVVSYGRTESMSTSTKKSVEPVLSHGTTESISTSTEGLVEPVVSYRRTDSILTLTEGPIKTAVSLGKTESMSSSIAATRTEGPVETTVSRGITESLSTSNEGLVETTVSLGRTKSMATSISVTRTEEPGETTPTTVESTEPTSVVGNGTEKITGQPRSLIWTNWNEERPLVSVRSKPTEPPRPVAPSPHIESRVVQNGYHPVVTQMELPSAGHHHFVAQNRMSPGYSPVGPQNAMPLEYRPVSPQHRMSPVYSSQYGPQNEWPAGYSQFGPSPGYHQVVTHNGMAPGYQVVAQNRMMPPVYSQIGPAPEYHQVVSHHEVRPVYSQVGPQNAMPPRYNPRLSQVGVPVQPNPVYVMVVPNSPKPSILPSYTVGEDPKGWGDVGVVEVENVTCLATEVMKVQKKLLRKHYRQNRTKCPSDYPCREFKSCALWAAGFVGADFTINKWIYKAYLQDLFDILSDERILEIQMHFEKCYKSTRVPPKIAEATHLCPSLVKHYKFCLHSSQFMGLCKKTVV